MTRPVLIAPAIIMAALSALVIYETRHLAYWADYAPGPAFAPWWIGFLGIVLSGLLAFHVMRAVPEGASQEPQTSAAGFMRAGAVYASILAFLILIPWLGLVLASVLTSAFIMLVILRRAPLPSLLSAVIAGALIYGIFLWWLQIPLPKGPLGF